MSTISILETKAITAAKKADWDAAVRHNQAILQQYPEDIGALNRTGFAYLQLGEIAPATDYFQRVLALERTNPIALRQLANIRNNTVTAPEFAAENFVEEPSKSKIVSLLRLASKDVLEKLVVGQQLNLRPKSRFISVETTDKVYLGSLPEDISLRLSQLIERGNRYSCLLHSASSKHCTVFIRETYQDPANRDFHSFVSNFQPGKDDNIGDELLLLADESPLNLGSDDDADNSDK